MNQVRYKLSYIGNKQQIIEVLKEEGLDLLGEFGEYLDPIEYEGYKKDLETLDDVDEFEKLITELDEDGNRLKDEFEKENNLEPKDDLRWWYYNQVL